MRPIEVVKSGGWNETVSEKSRAQATTCLEQGKVVFLPDVRFAILPEEAHLVSPQFASGRAKNISFNIQDGELRGAFGTAEDIQRLNRLLARFAAQAASLVGNLFPSYTPNLEMGRTSFRPVQIKGRVSSPRKDDTLLHVDAFPSNPVRDRRILRLFNNVDPNGEERVWRVGAPFEDVAKTFLPSARKQYWAEPFVLQALRITKTRRTLYDHTMLQLHNRMKADGNYQAGVGQSEVRFPAGSTWIVYTDQVSHAAMSGQHVLEQTFYLPVNAMADPSRSPLRILERLSASRMT